MFKVVIIDDEPWSRLVVQSLGHWDSYGLEVVGEAEDGEEGIRLIKELKPHIVITDMRMPGLQGVELLQELTLQHPSLKLLIMSGYNDFVYLQQAIRSRAVEYLLKPLNPEELNAALSRCVQDLKADDKASSHLQASPLQANPAYWNEYLAHRQKIYQKLQEGNLPVVLDGLGQLQAWMMNLTDVPQDGNWFSFIGHDLVSLLEGHITSGGLEWKAFLEPVWPGIPDMFYHLSSLYTSQLEEMELHRRRRGKLDLNEVKAYMDLHYMEPISLETIAQHFYVVKEHLSRIFKNHAGENITDYLVRKRMEKARELIAEQNVPIKAAAQITGYTDIAYFYRVFKKHFGIPPGELKK
jgi:two-component system, response regulator YesN